MGYSGRLRFFTILEKKVFRTSTILLSELIVSPSSINVIFALNGVLSERNRLTVLQNFLLSVILFRLRCCNIFFQFFLITKHSNSAVCNTFFCFHLIFFSTLILFLNLVFVRVIYLRCFQVNSAKPILQNFVEPLILKTMFI